MKFPKQFHFYIRPRPPAKFHQPHIAACWLGRQRDLIIPMMMSIIFVVVVLFSYFAGVRKSRICRAEQLGFDEKHSRISGILAYVIRIILSEDFVFACPKIRLSRFSASVTEMSKYRWQYKQISDHV